MLGKNNKFFTIIFPGQQSTLSGREMRERCFNDLEKLTRALEIYLSVFVEKIPCDKMDIITRIQPDYVMNFNYTNTYERTYSINEEKPKVFHVHGECNAGKTMEDNNMVLGIDEYLKDCEERGLQPELPYKGTFNVRISPDLHRTIATYAIEHGKSLNAAVEEAIDNMVKL